MNEIINKTYLPHNNCFGCGHENPHGLHIEIFRDADKSDRLLGVFHPAPYMSGFPGITHGGTIYTALDCLAAWVPFALRPGSHSIWILRSANLTYHRPAPPEQPIQLIGMIESEGAVHEAMTVRTEARNSGGDLIADGMFKTIPLPAEKFQKVAGVREIPENWKQMLEKF